MLCLVMWMQPLWAWGLTAAVLAPLAAHWLSRRRGRRLLFPAARFVARAAADLAQLDRPRHWLLLLLRIAMLACLTLAFMRPVWTSAVDAASQQGQRIILLLDRSASMSRIERGSSLLDEARRQVLAAVQSLDPHRDTASIVLIDSSPAPLLPELTGNLALLQDRLNAVRPSQERGDLPAAVAVGLGQLQQRDQKAHEGPIHVHLFSDLQASQWPGESWLRELAQQRVALHLHRIGGGAGNTFVRNPRLAPTQPVLGQVARLTVDVGHDAPQSREVMLRIEHGEQVRRVPVTLPSRGQAAVSTEWPITQAGPQQVDVSLEIQESLDLDDRTAVGFNVVDRRTVHLVSGSDWADPWRAAFYVARALQPTDRPTHGPRLTLLPTQPAQWPASSDMMVIVEAAAFDDAGLARLAAHLDGGGAALWIVDSAEAAASAQRFAAMSPWSPLRGGAWQWRPGQAHRIAKADFQHALWRDFHGPARAALMQTHCTAALQADAAANAHVLLRFDDGSPLLALQLGEHGGGLAILATDLAPSAGDLVKGPLLVPLLHELLNVLAPQPPAMMVAHPGQRPAIPLSGQWRASDLRVVGPRQQSIAIHGLIDTPHGTELQLDRLTQAGLYRIFDGAGEVRGQFLAEIDPVESELAVVDVELSAGSAAAVAAQASPRLREQTVELWPWCLAAMVTLLILEPLAMRWHRRAGMWWREPDAMAVER